MGSVTINSNVFQGQEDNLTHLAAALESASSRVLTLADIATSCREEEQTQLEKEISDLSSLLHCLGVVADATGSKVAEWRAWAGNENINITSRRRSTVGECQGCRES